jgi:cytochrome b561
MPMRDTATGYGWLSIALHWFTAVAVIVLLFLGDTISTVETVDGRADAVLLHTSVAMTSYVFLWARVILRFVYGHPGPLPKQKGFFYAVGKYTHFALLIAIAVMLISGPLMVWFGGAGIGVWDWFVIPTPFEEDLAARDTLHSLHAWSAAIVLILTLAHLVGVYKHTAFNQDGTFGKMLVPAKPDEEPTAAARPDQQGGRPADALQRLGVAREKGL